MPRSTPVRALMNSDVATLARNTTVADAADALADRRVGAMPVVDDDGVLLGLLRDEDLIMSEARLHVPTTITFLGASFTLPSEQRKLEEELHKVAGAVVGDVMSADPPTISADASVEDLATKMYEKDVTHVTVVDDDRHVVGIVARGDVVRFIARTT